MENLANFFIKTYVVGVHMTLSPQGGDSKSDHGKMSKNIFHFSSNTHLICFTGKVLPLIQSSKKLSVNNALELSICDPIQLSLSHSVNIQTHFWLAV